MDVMDRVRAQRFRTQGLTSEPIASVEEAVGRLVCVQSQDAPLARWSLAMRVGAETDDVVRAAVDAGRVIRTHVLRPTWHFVLAEDLRWLLELTSAKVISAMAARHRQLGLDDDRVVRREQDLICSTLSGSTHLTRRDLQTRLQRDDLTGERLGHLLLVAELRGLICSGPLDRGQHTYALVSERVPPTPARDREESVRALVHRFYAGHGPASLAHLQRWTTLTKTEIRAAVADLGDRLTSVEASGETLWYDADRAATDGEEMAGAGAFLMPVFDEAYLSYPGPSQLPRAPDHPWGDRGHSFAEAGGGLVVVDLRDVGWWKRRESGRTTQIRMGLAGSLNSPQRAEVEQRAARLAAYTGRQLDLRLEV